METWIHQALGNEHASMMVLMAVFVMGILSVFTCACNFAIIGVVAGYSGASHASDKTRLVIWKGIAFLIGTIISMSLIGAMFGFAGKWISDSLGNYWKIAAGLIAILFGLYSMDLVPVRLPGITVKSGKSQKNTFTAILFGLAVGGLAAASNSCCNPFFPVILAASFVKGSAAWGFMMLVFFALGFGLPLAAMIFGISLGLGKISTTLSKVVSIAKYIGGIALVAFGFYLLLTF
ncbi:MAG: sulfite exporter TauE/SafE family protein [Bacteroidetes bacterium]|nr:sulfite exporter TauE/SafE family protein [Bacteroidota bacterium]